MPRLPQDLKILSKFLDNQFKTPFGFSFGFDGIIGLIPIVGDILTNTLSGYIVIRAGVLGVPLRGIFKMLANIAFENIVGIIPFVGNLFDFWWKSNSRNLVLISESLELNRVGAEPSKKSTIALVVVLVIALVVLLGLMPV